VVNRTGFFAEDLTLKDPFENMGVQLLRQAAVLRAVLPPGQLGDGPNVSALATRLACTVVILDR
jgi:hypothetical protein